MRRKIVTSILLFCVIGLYAETEVATLYHATKDSTSVYFGMDAFKNAYKASEDGDVITLSSGAFLACDIAKEITIRGAGMALDTVNHIAPTILMGDFQAYTESKHSEYCLTMEGIYHYQTMYIDYKRTLHDANFVKCRFNKIKTNIYADENYSYFRDVVFLQCRIYDINLVGNATFYNCIVNDIDQIRTSDNPPPFTNFKFNNCCVLTLDPYYADYSSVENSAFYNCVLDGSVRLNASNTAFHCVAYYSGADTTTNMFSSLAAHTDNNNHSFTSLQAIFKTYTGSNLSDSENFELQDSIKTKYLGMDGTQVGIYGGAYPYSPKVSFPMVSKFKVAPKSDESGKLKVEMVVTSPQ